MSEDSLGDRMKFYEQAEAGRKFMPLLPVCARIDGKTFHSWTRGLERPYDKSLSDCMIETTEHLVDKTNACMGYTQSDEISLVMYSPSYETQLFFDGKVQKMISVLASMATAKFNELAAKRINGCPESRGTALFDCRAWQVPNKIEAANTLLWRELDAAKNSISMAARTMFGHSELQGKVGSEMQEMMFSKGTNWNDYPAFFKRGTFVQRRRSLRTLTDDERNRIPEKHRPAAGQIIERTAIVRLDMSPFSKINNRVEVVFDGADPEVEGHG
jgi:tRNA(His) 5'-end guanylyltransferase